MGQQCTVLEKQLKSFLYFIITLYKQIDFSCSSPVFLNKWITLFRSVWWMCVFLLVYLGIQVILRTPPSQMVCVSIHMYVCLCVWVCVWPQVLELACFCMTDGPATLFSPCKCSLPFLSLFSLSVSLSLTHTHTHTHAHTLTFYPSCHL